MTRKQTTNRQQAREQFVRQAGYQIANWLETMRPVPSSETLVLNSEPKQPGDAKVTKNTKRGSNMPSVEDILAASKWLKKHKTELMEERPSAEKVVNSLRAEGIKIGHPATRKIMKDLGINYIAREARGRKPASEALISLLTELTNALEGLLDEDQLGSIRGHLQKVIAGE